MPLEMTMGEWFCYAYLASDGTILADSDFDTPERAWQVGLGWPDAAEIDAAKQRGARVMRVRVIEVCEAPGEYDLTKCPGCGGPADNGHDRCVPPSPYFCTRCEVARTKRHNGDSTTKP